MAWARRGLRLLGAWLCVAGLAACSVTGQAFRSAGLAHLVPGQTTLEQAIVAFNAAPLQQWPQSDGGLLARWAQGLSLSTDALYVRQAMLLRFGPDGTFQAIEDTTNIVLVPSKRALAERARQARERAARERDAPAGMAPQAEGFIIPPAAPGPASWRRGPD